jgi:hypothetical protein
MREAQETGPMPRDRAKRLVLATAAAALVGLFLALLGPFGTYLIDDMAPRGAYWVGTMVLGVAVYGPALGIGLKLADRLGGSRWIAAILSVLLASLVHAALTRAIAFALWPQLAELNAPPAFWYLQVLVIALPVVLGFGLVTGRLGHRPPARRDLPRTAPGDPQLAAHLPPHLGREIICLGMEDHYVRVHTARGSTLLLMPFGQAIAEASPIEGLRTHRSWWVARAAVVRAEGDARAMRLRLANGMTAPVARAAVAHLRSLGWLEKAGGAP